MKKVIDEARQHTADKMNEMEEGNKNRWADVEKGLINRDQDTKA